MADQVRVRKEGRSASVKGRYEYAIVKDGVDVGRACPSAKYGGYRLSFLRFTPGHRVFAGTLAEVKEVAAQHLEERS